TAWPAYLVELEVPLVAGVALVAAPDLHRGAGIPHQGGHAALRPRRRHPISLVGRPNRRGCGFRRGLVPLRVEPLRAQRDLGVHPERCAGPGEMRVGEEISETGSRQMVLDGTPFAGPRPIGALRQPAAHRIPAEQPPVLAPPYGELQLHALVAGEQWEIAVCRRRADDLQMPIVLEPA